MPNDFFDGWYSCRYKGVRRFRCTPSRIIVEFQSPYGDAWQHGFDLERLTPKQIYAWAQLVPIQYAMPNLTATEREYFLTGFSDAEQLSLFGETE